MAGAAKRISIYTLLRARKNVIQITTNTGQSRLAVCVTSKSAAHT